MNQHILGLGHIAVYTKDMDESLAFYQKLGGEVLRTQTRKLVQGDKRFALVDVSGVVIELIEKPNLNAEAEGAVPHFALYVDDVDQAAQSLREAGIESFVTEKKNVVQDLFGGLENWFILGPSGEKVELIKMFDDPTR